MNRRGYSEKLFIFQVKKIKKRISGFGILNMGVFAYNSRFMCF